jgi:ABC-type nickel/cobalt efflux system permease component RcnA
VIAILWAVLIVVNFFARGFFEPNFLVWLSRLAADLIVLLAFWLINRKYA